MKLTREQIERMEAGAEIDALVAEHVMGWKVKVEQYPAYISPRPSMAVWHNATMPRPGPTENRYDARWEHTDWSPSRDIAAAWGIVERLCPGGCEGPGVQLDGGPGLLVDDKVCRYAARFFHANVPYYDVQAGAETMPLAICRAALLTTVKEQA